MAQVERLDTVGNDAFNAVFESTLLPRNKPTVDTPDKEVGAFLSPAPCALSLRALVLTLS